MKTIAFLLSACLLLGSAAAGAMPSDPEQLQTDAYVQVVQGDQSFDAGRLDEALGQYQDAKRLYERLAAGFPDWEPRIVRYRAAYCDNRIAEINQRVGERAAMTTAQTAASATAAYYGTPSDYNPGYESSYAPAPLPPSGSPSVPESLYQNAIRRADALQSQLDSARNAEQQARAELARVRGDLERANRSLSQRSVEADSELARLRDLQSRQQAEAQSLRAENERLKAQLASKADLEGALNDVERQLNRVRSENRELQDQLADLRQDLEDCEGRVTQAAELAAQAQADAVALASATPEAEAEAEPPAFDPSAFAWPEPEEEDGIADDASIPEMSDGNGGDLDEDEFFEETAPSAPAAPVGRVMATWPPRPIPRGMDAADFVRVLLANGETETAFATVQKAREDDPDDPALATLEGVVLIRLQHYAAAAELLHALSVEHPDDAAIHANLGAAWLGEGFYAGAREALRNAIELNPDIGGEYYYNLALVCAMTEPRDFDTARDAYRRALDAGVAPDPQLDAILP